MKHITKKEASNNNVKLSFPLTSIDDAETMASCNVLVILFK